MKKRLVSGITATGKLTIGNFLGSIKPSLSLQNEYENFIFVADLHALTLPINSQELAENRKSIFAFYLACGFDPEKTVLFFQSEISEHSELYWLLQSATTIGELSRMTQFKDKARLKQENNTEKVPTGLLTYPILMTADILLYNPNFVTVGADQLQHLELTRKIAQRFNKIYKTNFNIPRAIISDSSQKIMSLTNPEHKMSKSSKSKNSTIFLSDTPEEAYKKIQKAQTDSENKIYFSKEKPGVSNLLNIFMGFTGKNKEESLLFFENKSYQFLKKTVGKIVANFLENLQEKYKENLVLVEIFAKKGAKKAKKIASSNLQKIKEKMGL
ncbi:tryptophan--tRNA ligase [Mycoplasma flocculare]|uniref:Tryptophan--tRNA ligase n=1 Tax=Mesomycoplasma flocculare TaxID=2128 RepID=A0AAW9XBZ0_MESFC|nr:tryptophan--tRNA ligase [Mesomycoplasma flocculare]MXR39577.1 tryptophan--tRNA ligase [Mycoplasma sp. MF12]MXR05941.1 tryptophan--tRNA ligase [Mesomycoplasma flocculare]MXR12409.1 tryptophan--tRNA ligase [Mesomycoplasma flocculare]MXR23024.1 tryptophan--tRNA ligase [Mesomycoplasma flocculare]MXR56142.1 tryptophan--tRNA ligase [Mesomycoplasma flocculare]